MNWIGKLIHLRKNSHNSDNSTAIKAIIVVSSLVEHNQLDQVLTLVCNLIT